MMPLGMAVIKQWVEINSEWLPFISFALLFVISILLIRGAGFLLESFIKLIYLNFINRCIGGLAFSSLLLLIMSIMISAGKYLELFTTKLEEESLLLEYVAMVFPWLYEQYPIIKEYFNFFKPIKVTSVGLLCTSDNSCAQDRSFAIPPASSLLILLVICVNCQLNTNVCLVQLSSVKILNISNRSETLLLLLLNVNNNINT